LRSSEQAIEKQQNEQRSRHATNLETIPETTIEDMELFRQTICALDRLNLYGELDYGSVDIERVVRRTASLIVLNPKLVLARMLRLCSTSKTLKLPKYIIENIEGAHDSESDSDSDSDSGQEEIEEAIAGAAERVILWLSSPRGRNELIKCKTFEKLICVIKQFCSSKRKTIIDEAVIQKVKTRIDLLIKRHASTPDALQGRVLQKISDPSCGQVLQYKVARHRGGQFQIEAQLSCSLTPLYARAIRRVHSSLLARMGGEDVSADVKVSFVVKRSRAIVRTRSTMPHRDVLAPLATIAGVVSPLNTRCKHLADAAKRAWAGVMERFIIRSVVVSNHHVSHLIGKHGNKVKMLGFQLKYNLESKLSTNQAFAMNGHNQAVYIDDPVPRGNKVNCCQSTSSLPASSTTTALPPWQVRRVQRIHPVHRLVAFVCIEDIADTEDSELILSRFLKQSLEAARTAAERKPRRHISSQFLHGVKEINSAKGAQKRWQMDSVKHGQKRRQEDLKKMTRKNKIGAIILRRSARNFPYIKEGFVPIKQEDKDMRKAQFEMRKGAVKALRQGLGFVGFNRHRLKERAQRKQGQKQLLRISTCSTYSY